MSQRDPTVRNHVARSPLLRKSGPHVKSKTGQRVRARLFMNDLLDNWLEELEDTNDHLAQDDGEQEFPVLSAVEMTHKPLPDFKFSSSDLI